MTVGFCHKSLTWFKSRSVLLPPFFKWCVCVQSKSAYGSLKMYLSSFRLVQVPLWVMFWESMAIALRSPYSNHCPDQDSSSWHGRPVMKILFSTSWLKYGLHSSMYICQMVEPNICKGMNRENCFLNSSTPWNVTSFENSSQMRTFDSDQTCYSLNLASLFTFSYQRLLGKWAGAAADLWQATVFLYFFVAFL